MALHSNIEWTHSSWNPITGCSKSSPGCKNCYAERMSKRLKAMGNPNYANGFNITLHEHALMIPLKWKKPQIIFVNSMSDLFHEDVPFDFIKKVFEIMHRAHWHIFQVLTKRSIRLLELNPHLSWYENIWMGVSVEDKNYVNRIEHLGKTDARVKFVSLEPLLGALPNLNLRYIDWIIVGGESGPGARPMKEDWVIDICNQCAKANIPFFFKQWGGFNKKKSGRLLKGRTWDEFPNKESLPSTIMTNSGYNTNLQFSF